MRRIVLWSSGPICVASALITAWLFELSTEHVLVLAPVIVLGTAAVVGLVLFWVKAAWDWVRGPREPS
jgi:hypothetical protein